MTLHSTQSATEALANQAYWHLLLGAGDKEQARTEVVELCARLRQLFAEVFGEDLVVPAPLDLLDRAAFALEQSASAYQRSAIYGPCGDMEMNVESAATCFALAHDLGQQWVAGVRGQ